MSIAGSCFLFVFCLLLASRCSFVFVFLLVVLFVLNHNIMYFSLHALLLWFRVFVALVFVFVIFGYLSKKAALKRMETPKTPQNETCRNKTDI